MKMKHIKETEAAPVLSEQQKRLEYLRGELRAERISTGELVELQSLVKYIALGDVELLEAAGVPENAPVSGQHTPTPWVYGDAKGTLCAYRIVEPDERQRTIAFVAQTGSNAQDKANAEFIVRACNCHEELVRALVRLVEWDQYCEANADCGQTESQLREDAMNAARAALNKATR